MNKHEKAAIVDHLICAFMQIRNISMTSRVIDICNDGINKLYTLSEREKIQAELDAIRERRIDPTN